MTNHKYESTPVLMSAITWKRLSDPDRKIIREAAAEATLFQRKLMADSDEKLLAEYKKNPAVQVNSPDLAPFKAVTKVVWNDWEKKPFGDFVKKLRATIQ